ncbi:MAG: hypothetical protein Q4C76_05840 [Bacillota bacterium]|nr:hypothetical protein [Bacillota bacterium]
MKKLLIVCMSVVLMLSLSVTVWAAASYSYGVGLDSKEIPVTAKYVAASEADVVYSVDISWGSMEFTYTAGKAVWNPVNHTYDTSNTSTAVWACENDANKITVINHSNADVSCDLTYDKEIDSVTGVFDSNSYSFPSASNQSYLGNQNAEALKFNAYLTLSGTLDSTTTTATQVGTIIVTISSISE